MCVSGVGMRGRLERRVEVGSGGQKMAGDEDEDEGVAEGLLSLEETRLDCVLHS